MGVEWVMRISSVVFTRIKTEFSDKIKTKYKMTDKNFSTVGSNNTPAVFPFVYIHLLPAVEQAQDLECTSINGGLFTFQVDVNDNKSQANANEVMSEVMRIMKTMRFSVNEMPSFEDTKDIHRLTTRFRRSIGESDIL